MLIKDLSKTFYNARTVNEAGSNLATMEVSVEGNFIHCQLNIHDAYKNSPSIQMVKEDFCNFITEITDGVENLFTETEESQALSRKEELNEVE